MSREMTRDFGQASLYGRKVEEVDYDPDVLGRVGPLTTSTEDVLAFVRRNAEEIAEKNLEPQDDGSFVHTKTRTRYTVVTAFVDWPTEHDRDDGVHAFTVRDNLLVPLREAGSTERETTTFFGEIDGRMARDDDPIVMPAGTPVIY